MSENLILPYQVQNPTPSQRYEMVKYSLAADGRLDDIDNVMELLKPPQDILTLCPKGSGKNVKIAVIGAGDAGLSSAFELRKIGCDITIFEASDRVGGRVFTHYFDNNKKYFGDLGAMRIASSHSCTWHYIDLFKLNTYPFVSKNITSRFYNRGAYAINDSTGENVMKNIYPRYNLTPEEKRTPWFELLGKIMKKYLNSIPPAQRKELIEIKSEYSDYIKLVDSLSYRQAYESVGLSQEAITMIGYLAQFEATFFKLGLTEVLQEAYTVDYSFLYYIEEGMVNLPNSLYGAITDKIDAYKGISREELGKVKINFNSAVEGIYGYDGNGSVTLCSRDILNSTCSFEKFDFVVCAIPFSSLRRTDINPLFRVQKMQAIRELNYENSHKSFLFLKDRFWEKNLFFPPIYGGPNATDLPNISSYFPSDHAVPVPGHPDAWDRKPGTSPNEPGVLLSDYTIVMEANRLGSEDIDILIPDVIRYVEMSNRLPRGYINSRLISYASRNWQDVQYIWAVACLGKVLDKLNFSHVVTLPEMNDRVFFAGEHISQKHAWQQGSLQTAMIAANEIAKRIKAKKS